MIGPLSLSAPSYGLLARRFDGANVHAVHLLAGNVKGAPPLREVGGCGGALDRRAHPVLVVFDDVDHRQLPQLRHVEAFVDLPLVGRAVAEIGQRDIVVPAILVGEGESGAERHLCADDAMPAEEALLDGEHVHRAALALGVAVVASRQLGHDALGIHPAGQHVAVIAIAGDHLVARLECHLHADDNRFLPDVEVTEAADQSHAVELTRLFLEPPDQEHVTEGLQLPLLAEIGCGRCFGRGTLRWCAAPDGGLCSIFVAGDGHAAPRK
jgi:hypothetical protein